MRRESFKPQWSMTVLLLAVNVVVYVLQVLNAGHARFIDEYLALSNHGLAQGYVWQVLTFQFLHGGIWHLLFNLLAIYFFGRLVEERLGKATFVTVYFLSGIMGGLLQIFMGWLFPEQFRFEVLGASAGAFGLIAAATMLDPDSIILVSFIIPLKAKYFLLVAAGISLAFMFVPDTKTAHAAHLGGILTGVAYMRWGNLCSSFFQSLRPRDGRFRARDFIKIQSKGRGWQRGKGKRAVDLPPEEFISREVDPILDKISAHGIQSLTPQEREILETARAKMESVKRDE